MIYLTENAKNQISEVLSDGSGKYVRAFVQGGGCSGFSYNFSVEEDKEEDDFVFENLLIDSMSMQYFENATIDYKDDLSGSQFVISNPNATSTCGCGSSFSV